MTKQWVKSVLAVSALSMSFFASAASQLTANLVISSDWNSGYCAKVYLKNVGTTASVTWTTKIDIGSATLRDNFSSVITGTTGIVTITPGEFNAVINPGAEKNFGYCALGAARPAVVSVTTPGGTVSSTPASSKAASSTPPSSTPSSAAPSSVAPSSIPKSSIPASSAVRSSSPLSSSTPASSKVASSVANQAGITIYNGAQQSGTNALLTPSGSEYGIYNDTAIPQNLNDAVESIKINAGYQVILAANSDGTGYSKVYIARTETLKAELPSQLKNKVSFIRVMPFRNVAKKGMAIKNNQAIIDTQSAWVYDWGTGDVSTQDYEYVLMQWGRGGVDVTKNILDRSAGTTHLLTYNEPDSTDQSGAYGGIIDPAFAAGVYVDLLKTGMRMGSPACTENQADKYLFDFMKETQRLGHRVDYIALHWYDWGNYSSTKNANPNPTEVANRFKNYVTRMYNIYKMPIWITEFNANPNRGSAIQKEFLQLVLPWLEDQPFVERYAFFQCKQNCLFYNENNELSPIGITYRDHRSTPSIPEATWKGQNSLDVVIQK